MIPMPCFGGSTADRDRKFPDKTAFYSGGQAVWSFEMLTGKKYKEYKPNSVAQLG